MSNNDNILIGPIKNESDRSLYFEQYKIVAESINKINDMRESSNQFWITVNAFGISGLAYLRDCQNINQQHKFFILLTLTILGIIFCLSWTSYLLAIKKTIEIRSRLLEELEKNFPVGIFSKIFSLTGQNDEKSIFTAKEIAVPCLFLSGYFFFLVILFMFPQYCVSK